MLTSIICFSVGVVVGYILRIVHINVHVARLMRGMEMLDEETNNRKGVIGFDTSKTLR